MSGGIESMHEDRTKEELEAARLYFEWARELPPDQMSRAALELSHMLIIALANYAYTARKCSG